MTSAKKSSRKAKGAKGPEVPLCYVCGQSASLVISTVLTQETRALCLTHFNGVCAAWLLQGLMERWS